MQKRREVQHVIEYILTEEEKPTGGAERRQAERHVVMLPVTAYVMEKRNKLPTPIDAVVRDISSTGVAILVKEPLVAEMILLDFGETYENSAFAFEPVRMSNCGGFVQIAGPFVDSGLER